MKKLLPISIRLMGLILFIFMTINSNAQDATWWNSWVKYPTNQPVIVGDYNSWSAYLSTPTVIFEDNIFKMWFRGIDKENTEQQIGYAWSDDGINWNVKEEPVIPAVTEELECIIKGTGTVLRINDTLRMWYWCIFPDYSAAISYAWSVDDTTWHEREEPVFERGESGTWDESDPYLNYIYYDTTKYHMFYTASESVGGYEEVGHATSDDGILWERDPSNPVLKLGPNGSFYDYRMLGGPVILHNDTLHMFFSGYDRHDGYQHPCIGYAFSTDSPSWSKWTVGNNHMPVLNVGEPGSWDHKYADLPGVLYHNGIFHMWYDGRTVPIDGKIGYARQNVSCLPEGIDFAAQAEIDSFKINYPYCNEIEGTVRILGADISDLSGLSQITSIEDSLVIGAGWWACHDSNPLLTSLVGLDNLTCIGGDLLLFDNSVLTSLSGLENLTSIAGSLIIGDQFYDGSCGNPSLTSLSALDNLAFIGGNLKIYNNDVLSICNINSICDYLVAPNGEITIRRNADGCNSMEEVSDSCNVNAVNELNIEGPFSIYPNPFSGAARLRYQIPDTRYLISDLYSITGIWIKRLLEEEKEAGEYELELDMSELLPGVYFCTLQTGYGIQIVKLIKL